EDRRARERESRLGGSSSSKRSSAKRSAAVLVVTGAPEQEADEEADAGGDEQRLAGGGAHVLGRVLGEAADVLAHLAVAGADALDGRVDLLARRLGGALGLA